MMRVGRAPLGGARPLSPSFGATGLEPVGPDCQHDHKRVERKGDHYAADDPAPAQRAQALQTGRKKAPQRPRNIFFTNRA